MIELYTWTTPNGRKPLILLEELGLPYEAHAIDIGAGEQHEPTFLAINPNGKIPALVDRLDDGSHVQLFESGAVLIYLAEKCGRLLPSSGQARAETLSWLMFQVGGVGPMFGQLGHFRRLDARNEYALERYGDETKRLFSVLDQRLKEVPYLAGEYSIADIATYPWAKALEMFELPKDDYPHVVTWMETIGERAAVKKAEAWKP